MKNRLTQRAWNYIRKEKAERKHQAQYKDMGGGCYVKI